MVQNSTQHGAMPSHIGIAPDRPAYGLCLLIMLLHVVDGVDMQLLGVTVNALTRDWNLPLSSFSTAMAAGHAGAAVGAILGGYLGDRLGRKPVIIGGVLLFSMASIAMAFAGAPWHLALLRLVAGIGLGGCLPPALALLADNMPARYRGLAISLVMLCFPLGIALAGFLAIIVIPQAGWPAMFLLGGAIPLGLAMLLFWGLGAPKHSGAPSSAFDHRGTMGQLLIGEERAKLLPLLGVFFCCYFTTNMALSWLPALMARSGAPMKMASGAISLWSIAGMVGVLLAGLIMTRWGIRRAVGLYISGGIIALASLAASAAGGAAEFAELPFLALLALGGFMLSGTVATIFAYCADIFASEVRSSAIGLSATAGRLGAVVGAAGGARFLEWGGATGFFGVATAMFACTLLLYAVAIAGLKRHSAASVAE